MSDAHDDDFIRGLGLPYYAHLLRRLSDEFVDGLEGWNVKMGLTSPTRTRSTLMAVHEHGPIGITQIAALIRQTHPAVINWGRQLTVLGLVTQETDAHDKRRTLLRLTRDGRDEVTRLGKANALLAAAYRDLMEEAGADVFEGLWRIEQACRRKSFGNRLEAVADGT